MKISGTVLLLSLLVTGCSHHESSTSEASVNVPAQSAGPAAAKHDAAPSDEAVKLTIDKTMKVDDGEQCLVAAAATPTGTPLEAFAYMHNFKAYNGSHDPFVHKDMAKAIAPLATQMIAKDNPTGTRYIAYTTPVKSHAPDLLNPYQETWQHYHGFPIVSGYLNGAVFPQDDQYVCNLVITNNADFTTLRVNDEAKARDISKLQQSGPYALRFLAQVDNWSPPSGDADSNPEMEITLNAHLLKIQILDASGQVLAEDTKSPNTGTP